jgi:putative transcriptional regulator
MMLRYNECGLRNIWLTNGFKRVDTPYGRSVSIDAIEDLHRAIVLELVMKPSKLAATEIRILRKEMELSQASLATMLGVSAQALARWERAGAESSHYRNGCCDRSSKAASNAASQSAK